MSVRNDILTNLLTEMKTIRTSTDYEAGIAVDPIIYHQSVLGADKSETPMLMVVDEGTERVAVRTATETMYVFDISIWGYVSGFDWDETQEQLNALIADVKKWINTSPSLGDAVLQLRFVEVVANQYDETNKRALTQIAATIRYKVTNGTY